MPTTPPAPVIGLDRYGERRRTKSPGCDAVADRDNAERGGDWCAGRDRQPVWNEGVGEHVRTIFQPGFRPPREIADIKIRTERRKLVSSAGSVFKRANSPNSDPAV